MRPIELYFLLHCHTQSIPHENIHSLEMQEVLVGFLARGIVTGDRASIYLLTDKGLKFLNMILDTPYPEQAYIDPRCGAVL